MGLSNEDIVTNILSKREILKKQEVSADSSDGKYSTNPIEYDLSLYIKTRKNRPEPGRFGSRYIFVK